MKTNATFYNAVDWQREHRWDFHKQFDKKTWYAAGYYVQEVGKGRPKKEVLAEVRNNEFEYNQEFGIYLTIKRKEN